MRMELLVGGGHLCRPGYSVICIPRSINLYQPFNSSGTCAFYTPNRRFKYATACPFATALCTNHHTHNGSSIPEQHNSALNWFKVTVHLKLFHRDAVRKEWWVWVEIHIYICVLRSWYACNQDPRIQESQ